MKLIAYARVSTGGQRDGLAVQEQTIREWAVREGHTIVPNGDGLCHVEKKSGKRIENRPVLLRVLERIEAGEADGLVVSKLDRLARSTIDTLQIVERTERKSWRLFALDMPETQGAEGEFFITILAAFARMERRRISQRTVDQKSWAASVGRATGLPPFGLRCVGPSKERADEPDPARWPVLLRIRDALGRGESIRKIAAELKLNRGTVARVRLNLQRGRYERWMMK